MTSHCCNQDQPNKAVIYNINQSNSNPVIQDFDWESNFQLIVAGIAAKIGEEFFQACVQYLAKVLKIQYALIAEFVEDEEPFGRVLAFWAGEDFGPTFEYPLVGTPCGVVYQKGLKIYQDSIQQLFPEDHDLVTMEAESYLGIAIVDSQGKNIGHIAGLHTKPLQFSYEQYESILKIFAARSAAEIERQITETTLKKQNVDLQVTLEKLKSTQLQLIQAEKMSGLGQMVAGVAHEINNPVTFISGNLTYVKEYSQDLLELIKLFKKYYSEYPDEIKKFVEEIELEYIEADLPKLLGSMKGGTDRITKIVQSLRTFSRLDESEIKVVNVHEGIESILMILQSRLKTESCQIEVIKNYGDLPLVHCYARLLNQAIMNILNNGIDVLEMKFNQGQLKTEKPMIEIRTENLNNQQIAIYITDNGLGMSEENRSKIFDPFFTTKPVGKGTGLGLSITHQIIVEQHGGQINCHSQPGKGTEFVIEIPV